MISRQPLPPCIFHLGQRPDVDGNILCSPLPAALIVATRSIAEESASIVGMYT